MVTENLVECKSSGSPLTRLKSKDQVEYDFLTKMHCPTCGRSLKEENLTEVYTISDLGQLMTKQSHWMTVWVTDLLNRLGVPLEAILWNISENGEEVDILMELFGQTWIFELKDREFGAGNAYALNYRSVRYSAEKTVIVASEGVAENAKRVFKDLREESQNRGQSGAELPIYVESIASAGKELEAQISLASLDHARRKVSLVGMSYGYNLGAVLAARYDEVQVEDSEQEGDITF